LAESTEPLGSLEENIVGCYKLKEEPFDNLIITREVSSGKLLVQRKQDDYSYWKGEGVIIDNSFIATFEKQCIRESEDNDYDCNFSLPKPLITKFRYFLDTKNFDKINGQEISSNRVEGLSEEGERIGSLKHYDEFDKSYLKDDRRYRARGKLSVKKNKITAMIGKKERAVRMRGVNVADPQFLDIKHNERPRVNALSVTNLAVTEFSAEVIRLPILPGTENEKEGWFGSINTRDKNYFNDHIKPLVEKLTKDEIYVIIDLHYVKKFDVADSFFHQNIMDFWRFMAPKFKDNEYVLYELFNEPSNECENCYDTGRVGREARHKLWKQWKLFIQPVVNLVRSKAPDNLIIVGGPGWSHFMDGAVENDGHISGGNIVYAFHSYAATSREQLKAFVEPILSDYPVFVSEWGFEHGATECGSRESYGAMFLDWMNKNRLSWTVWNFDVLWEPRMFKRAEKIDYDIRKNWELLVEVDPKTGHTMQMGQFVKDALSNKDR
jgi:endoglucanase